MIQEWFITLVGRKPGYQVPRNKSLTGFCCPVTKRSTKFPAFQAFLLLCLSRSFPWNLGHSHLLSQYHIYMPSLPLSLMTNFPWVWTPLHLTRPILTAGKAHPYPREEWNVCTALYIHPSVLGSLLSHYPDSFLLLHWRPQGACIPYLVLKLLDSFSFTLKCNHS